MAAPKRGQKGVSSSCSLQFVIISREASLFFCLIFLAAPNCAIFPLRCSKSLPETKERNPNAILIAAPDELLRARRKAGCNPAWPTWGLSGPPRGFLGGQLEEAAETRRHHHHHHQQHRSFSVPPAAPQRLHIPSRGCVWDCGYSSWEDIGLSEASCGALGARAVDVALADPSPLQQQLEQRHSHSTTHSKGFG